MTHRKRFNLAHSLQEVGRSLKPVGHIVKDVIEMPNHMIDKVGNVGQSLALPLIIVGGIVLFIVVKDKL